MNLPLLIGIVIAYLLIMSGLAYLGNKQTRTAEDYLVAGRRAHPVVMALSYGATFISTSAIIGFGGAAALYGFGMLWLAFLNIFVGIFVAFAAFGVRLRRMASNLGATTFPTLLGERYQSRWITAFSGLMIFLFMPAYTSIVLIGGGRFLQETLKVDFNVGLMLLALIVGLYVVTGGLKAVLYTDAFCALVMMVGMVFLLFKSYFVVGGVLNGHEGLSAMRDLVPADLVEQGHRGWTAMPEFGSPLWWTLVSTLIMGVGIGVLAQPQLAMRSMTVRDNRSLYRAVLIGGVFMFFMTGTAFMAGPLSNLYFHETRGEIAVDVAGGNIDLIMPIFINQIMPEWFLYLFTLALLSAAISTISSLIHVQGAAFGEDILKTLGVKSGKGSLNLSKMGVLVGVVAAVIFGLHPSGKRHRPGDGLLVRHLCRRLPAGAGRRPLLEKCHPGGGVRQHRNRLCRQHLRLPVPPSEGGGGDRPLRSAVRKGDPPPLSLDPCGSPCLRPSGRRSRPRGGEPDDPIVPGAGPQADSTQFCRGG